MKISEIGADIVEEFSQEDFWTGYLSFCKSKFCDFGHLITKALQPGAFAETLLLKRFVGMIFNPNFVDI
ncbi:MAG: hypothetical protein LBP41_03365 [Holosporaceae bacterium]|jgi:hypothetical protein|nr:hypothetical protein [Holosporaceae bacterium]